MQAYLRLRNCLTSSTDKSKRCSAIKRIGRKMIEGFSRRGACASGQSAIYIKAALTERWRINRARSRTRVVASTPFASSSNYGASPR
jgi:hypothetical protein